MLSMILYNLIHRVRDWKGLLTIRCKQGVTNPECQFAGRLHFVQWRQIYVNHQRGSYLLPTGASKF
jgi:hypothetical protein